MFKNRMAACAQLLAWVWVLVFLLVGAVCLEVQRRRGAWWHDGARVLDLLRRRMVSGRDLVTGVIEAASIGSSNPLDFIDENGKDFPEKCRGLAKMLVIRSGEDGLEKHFNDTSETALTALIAFVCACEPDDRLRNLTTVRKLASSRWAFRRATETMQKVEGFGGVLSRLGKLLQSLADRELRSLMIRIQRHSAGMDSPLLAACLSHQLRLEAAASGQPGQIGAQSSAVS